MSIYQKPKSRGTVYTFVASGWDRFDRRASTPADGTKVRKTKAAYGAPKNGTMGHCFVENADTGAFIGLVCCASLTLPPLSPLQVEKTFRVVASSTNTNSFGLRQYTFVSKDGEAWKACRSDSIPPGQLVTGSNVTLKLAVDMRPFWAGQSFELPERFSDCLPAVLKEIFG